MAIQTISVTRARTGERSKQILYIQAYQHNQQQISPPPQEQKEQPRQIHIPSEILLEVFRHCHWQDRFALSQVCQRWRALSHKVLFPKAFNQTYNSLQNFPPSISSTSAFIPHKAFSSLRLIRGDTDPALQSYILLPTSEQIGGFPTEKRLCESPARNDPAVYPPLTEFKLRFQYQPLLRNLIPIDMMKPTPTYRFKGKTKQNGSFVTVGHVCECICECLNNDRYLKE